VRVSSKNLCFAGVNSLLLFLVFSFASPLVRQACAAGGSISGTVLRSDDSTPIEGVYVDAYDNNWNYVTSGYTDVSGNYSITELALGNYRLQTFNVLGFINKYFSNSETRPGATTVSVVEGQDRPGKNFSLTSGAGSVSGRVTRSSDGRGLSGICVTAYIREFWGTLSDVAIAYTDFRGRYTIPGLGSRTYYLKTSNATTFGYLEEYYNNSDIEGGASGVSVASDANTGNINFSLDLGGIISGRVTRDSDGVGIPNVEIRYLTNADFFGIISSGKATRTDDEGDYRFTGLPPGNYGVFTSDSQGYTVENYDGADWMGAKAVAVFLGAETSDIDFGLSEGGTISGRVTRDSDGAGIGGATIIAQDTNLWGCNGNSDASGYYHLRGCPPAAYYVQVSATDYVSEYYGNAGNFATATAINVNLSVDTPDINFSLAPVLSSMGKVSGTIVRDSDGGTIYGLFTVRAFDLSWNQVASVVVFFSNSYSINLPPGDYYIATNNVPNYIDMYYNNVYSPGAATPVTVTAGVTQNINFRMADQGGSISGTITRNSDGAVLNGVPIVIYDTSWNRVKAGSSNALGTFNIGGLAPGSYYVATDNVQHYRDEYYDNVTSKGSATAVVVSQGTGTPGHNFGLDPGGSIVGAVLQDSDGKGIAGVVVHAYNTNWDYVASSDPTDTYGNFRIEGLTPASGYYLKTSNSLGYIDRYCVRTTSQSRAHIVNLIDDKYLVTIRLSKPALPIADFTDDVKSDAAVWRPGAGYWYVLNSDGSGDYAATQWGVASDLPVPGDYDGDGMADVAVYRPDAGMWYILPSGSQGTYTSTAWGMLADIAVPADYDGDDITDIAIWRPGTATWYIIPSTGAPGTYRSASLGSSEDVPVPADYDGDGKTDLATWRPGNATWYVMPSESPGTYTTTYWGTSTDKPVPGDYDRDGKADQGIWRPSTGMWHILPSNAPGTYTSIPWGTTDDIPVPGDYDGDGTTDIAVWRPADGTWYIQPSDSPGTYISTPWGQSGDVPVSAITGILRTLP
jgi:hypothetical protein